MEEFTVSEFVETPPARMVYRGSVYNENVVVESWGAGNCRG
jgi:hypothetical protein